MILIQSNCTSLKYTLVVPKNIPSPKMKTEDTNRTGRIAMILMSILYPKKNINIEKGINDSKRLKIAARVADNGKLIGCKLIDFSIAALSINEVRTCKTEADRKFQKTNPLKAYSA